MADKKYQIFVSSTYKDLIDERDIAIEAILGLGYLPASMERFSASSNNQMNYIKKIIDNCDYYLLIIGDRYGTIDEKSGISYTEQEYDYAISKGIPVLAFWKEKVEESDNLQELQRFTRKVQEGRLCKSWNTITDLQSVIYPSLINETQENPQTGWTRGGGADNTELLKQLNQVRQEKETLQNQVGELQAELQKHICTQIEDLAGMDEEFEFEAKYKPYDSYDRKEKFKLTWNDLFSIIGAYFISPKSYFNFESQIKESIKEWSNVGGCSYFSLKENDINTVKIQLDALGLIKVYQAQAFNGGVHEFIKLTPKGKQYLMQIKTIKSSKEEVIT